MLTRVVLIWALILLIVRRIYDAFRGRHLLILLLLARVASAQDLDKTAVPITKLEFRGLSQEMKFGTGFCIDAECRFIATNYHVAKAMGNHYSIKGSKVINKWLATGPEDEGAIKTNGGKYNPVRDLAVVELRTALSEKGFHGIAFNPDDLEYGQDAYIYAFPFRFNPKRSLMKFHAKFVGYNKPSLSLLFEYEASDGKYLSGGASGGLVVDAQGRVIGILSGLGATQVHIAVAVPVRSLSDFLAKVQPYLTAQLFPHSVIMPPVAADAYAEWIPEAQSRIEHRPVETPDIQALRKKAQALADSMRNFIAVESVEWGKQSASSTPQAVAQYEVRVLEGYQRFREYPDGKKQLQDLPFPALGTAITPGGEWSEVPDLVGSNLKLKIHRAPDTVVNGKTYHVFQWRGEVEDAICQFKSVVDMGFMNWSKTETLSCFGEAWTDSNDDIVRVSENYKLLGQWKNYRGIVTYGTVTIDDHTAWVPLTMHTAAEHSGKIYWCRGLFTNYHQFGSTVKMGTY